MRPATSGEDRPARLMVVAQPERAGLGGMDRAPAMEEHLARPQDDVLAVVGDVLELARDREDELAVGAAIDVLVTRSRAALDRREDVHLASLLVAAEDRE